VIGGRRITAPDGTAWRVGRRWLPERKRLRRRRDRSPDILDAGGSDGSNGGDASGPDGGGSGGNGSGFDIDLPGADDAIAILLIVLAVIAVVFLLTTVVIPILVVGIELLLVIALFVAGLAGRLLFRRPWTIRARSADGRQLTWRAAGFRRSGRVRDEIAGALAQGQTDVQPVEAS
jgi:hypothetical protein